MKDVQLPLYHDNTVLRTEDFTNLKDSTMENLLTLLRGLTGYDGAQLLREYWGDQKFPSVGRSSLFVLDGFLPCTNQGKPVENLNKYGQDSVIYVTPGIALYCSAGTGQGSGYRNELIVSSAVKGISIQMEDGSIPDNGWIMGRIVKREDFPKNILTRDSLSGKSYVKEYQTFEVYDVEFKVVKSELTGSEEGEKLQAEGWFQFGDLYTDPDGHHASISSGQFNLISIFRELVSAASSRNSSISAGDILSVNKDPVLRNLARWDNEGKLQTNITANYKSSFKNIDLVNRYYVDMVMQEERLRVNQILAEQYDILPTGTILMYNGKNWQNDVTIPGWYMCDGDNGTPDLRERFIAGCSYSADRTIPNAPGNFGGDNSFRLKTDHLPAHAHSIPAHNHAGTISNGGAVNKSVATGGAGKHSHTTNSNTHSHTFVKYYAGAVGPTGVNGASNDTNKSNYSTSESTHSHTCSEVAEHNHTVSIDISAHSHSITIASDGSGNTGSIGGNAAVDLSKSVKGYAVIFIMKTE